MISNQMLLKRQEQPLSYKEISSYHTTLLWCSDGWVYDPVAMKRRRFFTGDVFSMEEEPITRTAFSDVQYIEEVKIIVLSESPRMWIEQGELFTQI
jgi:hypothetical protein